MKEEIGWEGGKGKIQLIFSCKANTLDLTTSIILMNSLQINLNLKYNNSGWKAKQINGYLYNRARERFKKLLNFKLSCL